MLSKPLIHKGFTLIELMIALAIVGILSALALPSYREYVIKGKVQEATSGLADYRSKMEQFYQNNRTYLDTDGKCGALASNKIGDYFTFSCQAIDAENYTLNATSKSSVGLDDGYAYSLNNTGVKTSQYGSQSSSSCWITSKAGC